MSDERRQRLLDEAEVRIAVDGENRRRVERWLGDELDLYGHTDHLCYSDDPLFTSTEVVRAMLERLKRWHRTVGRPVEGEGFEDLLAGVWRDVGFDVVLAPRHYDGADAHVSLGADAWVAMSLKSEGGKHASNRTIHLSPIGPHHVDLTSPAQCAEALREAELLLIRYDRLLYLRSEEGQFPASGTPAQRYTIVELPKELIAARLHELSRRPDAFSSLFAETGAEHRNVFTVPVLDEHGGRLFNVSLTKKPPRISVSTLAFDLCDLLASYWTELAQSPERLTRAEAAAGTHSQSRRPRRDPQRSR